MYQVVVCPCQGVWAVHAGKYVTEYAGDLYQAIRIAKTYTLTGRYGEWIILR